MLREWREFREKLRGLLGSDDTWEDALRGETRLDLLRRAHPPSDWRQVGKFHMRVTTIDSGGVTEQH